MTGALLVVGAKLSTLRWKVSGPASVSQLVCDPWSNLCVLFYCRLGIQRPQGKREDPACAPQRLPQPVLL